MPPVAPIAPERIPFAPVVTPPAWWKKFLERKFLVAIAVSTAALFGLLSGALPLTWELVVLILAPVLVWLGIESTIDWRRIQIPQVPGVADDVARALLAIAATLAPAPSPKPEPSAEAAPREPPVENRSP
jgi:hypothetical protein